MKTVFALTILFMTGTVDAAPYTFTPEARSEAVCRRLGFVGEFRLKRNTGNSWLIVFATGADLPVGKRANGEYYNYASCAFGCSGYTETRLNLSSKRFSYWNSIDRSPEACNGGVQ